MFASSLSELAEILVPAITTVIGGVIGIIGTLLVQWLRIKHGVEPDVNALTARLNDRAKEIRELSADNADLRHEKNGLSDENVMLKADLQQAKESLKAVQQQLADVTGDRNVSQATAEGLNARVRAMQRRIRWALEHGGMLWTRPVLRSYVPKFVELGKRESSRQPGGMPIVSVLNLKGGVGKTTLAAYIGAFMASRGFRVLYVDLDLQGSLSSLFLEESEINPRTFPESDRGEEKPVAGTLLRHYFEHSYQRSTTSLRDYLIPIGMLPSGSSLIGTTDGLAYAELQLTYLWLLRATRASQAEWDGGSTTKVRDARFLLRRGLHRSEIWKGFDLAILDCPPMLNLSCINALAASDRVLVPVIPSRRSTERVPRTLEFLRTIREGAGNPPGAAVNPSLNVLGVMLNRTFRWKPNDGESEILTRVCRAGADAWGHSVHSFRTVIPNLKDVRNMDRFAMPTDEKLRDAFSRLCDEIIEQLPNCRLNQTVGPAT